MSEINKHEAIRFTLSGNGAVFKRPDMNTVNATFLNVHKVALLGIFGAILGLGGHRDMCYKNEEIDYYNKQIKTDNAKIRKANDEEAVRVEKIANGQKAKLKGFREELPLKVKLEYPPFYETLKGLKVSIIPYNKGFSSQSQKVYTETTGCLNDGNTLIVKEHFLVKPKWDIYVMKGTVSDEMFDKLKDYLLKSKGFFIPFLGRNHYPAKISNVEITELNINENLCAFDSLFSLNNCNIEDDPSDLFGKNKKSSQSNIKYYKEELPVGYRKVVNHYKRELFAFTGIPATCTEEGHTFTDSNRRLELYFI